VLKKKKKKKKKKIYQGEAIINIFSRNLISILFKLVAKVSQINVFMFLSRKSDKFATENSFHLTPVVETIAKKPGTNRVKLFSSFLTATQNKLELLYLASFFRLF
jgi:hypothetical protein